MKSVLDQVILGNTFRDYLWVLGVILFVLLLKRFISRYIAVLACRILRRHWKSFDQERFMELILHPLGVFLVITVSIIAFYRLDFPAELDMKIYKYPLKRILLSIAVAVQLLAFIWLLLRSIDFIASILQARARHTASQSDNQLIVFFRDFLKVVIGIIGAMMILHFAFSYDVSSLLTGLSIVGAAIALALRESLENLIASFVIFFDKPFVTGDFVKVQNIAGSVERIGLRSTRVRTSDKSYVTVPNKQMVDSILDNISLRSQIRGELNLLLKLDAKPAQLTELTDALKKYLAGIREVQGFSVLFNDIRVQGYVVFVEYFTPNMPWPQFTAIRQSINFFALQKMEELGLEVQRGN